MAVQYIIHSSATGLWVRGGTSYLGWAGLGGRFQGSGWVWVGGRVMSLGMRIQDFSGSAPWAGCRVLPFWPFWPLILILHLRALPLSSASLEGWLTLYCTVLFTTARGRARKILLRAAARVQQKSTPPLPIGPALRRGQGGGPARLYYCTPGLLVRGKSRPPPGGRQPRARVRVSGERGGAVKLLMRMEMRIETEMRVCSDREEHLEDLEMKIR